MSHICAEHAFPRSIGATEFRAKMSYWTTGVSVITAAVGGRPVGLVSNSFTSVSLEPPLVSWCVDRCSSSIDTWLAADGFAVHVLASGQGDLVTRFARRGGDKFEGLDWEPGEAGAPLLPGSTVRFQCRTWNRHEAGDHIILIGLVTEARHEPRPPMVFALGGISPSSSAVPAKAGQDVWRSDGRT